MGAWYDLRADRTRSQHRIRYRMPGEPMTSRSFSTKEEADAFHTDILLAIEIREEEIRY